jgi:hypothetical protein
VDHHEVEVCHCRPHERFEAQSGLKTVDEGVHESWDVTGVGSFVDDLVAAFVANVDRPGAVAAGRLGVIVAQHHIVHGPDLCGVECGVVFVTHGQDVAQSLAVTLDFQEGLLFSAERCFTIHSGCSVILGDLVSLDAVGALDGAG